LTDPEKPYKDFEGWGTGWTVTFDGMEEFLSIDIGGYPHGDNSPGPDFHGVVTLLAWDSTEGAYIIENVYETDYDIGACYLPFQGTPGKVTVDLDPSTETYFEALEISDDPDYGLENSDGVFLEYCWLEPGNADWWVNDWPGFVFEGAFTPDIAVSEGNCYCVCQVEGNIVMYYSHDNGASFESTLIAENGAYPSVTAVGETVIVSFIRNGNIFSAMSEDGGVTWEIFSQINEESGSVVEGEYMSEVAGSNLIWTDNRNGINSIYFDKAGEVAVPIIEVESISGGMGASAVITNTGTGDSSAIDWSINFEGGVFIGAETTGTIPSLAPGESVTISSNFIIGLGATTITVTAGSASKQASGTVLLFFVLGI
jgi:hypothetical protein